MTRRVILDFDNTMGVPDCDVDDALALLHLLGSDDVDILGLCTAYGNSTIDIVHENTLRLLDLWKLDVPVYRGSAKAGDRSCEAACFLADQVAAHPGEVTVIATGSTTNLYGASCENPLFFEQVKGIYLMGGLERTLVINGRIMNELNLSCDAQATEAILQSGCPVTIATAHSCLDAFYTKEDFRTTFGVDSWLTKTCEPWFKTMEKWYEWNGFACWDVVAAAMFTSPELFGARELSVTLNPRLLQLGYLERAEDGAPAARIHAPTIADPHAFTQIILKSWQRGLEKLAVD